MSRLSSNPNSQRVRVLLCGYGHLGLALLQGLLAAADLCEVVGVFRWASRPQSAHFWEPVEDDFKQLLTQAGLTDVQCDGLNGYAFTQVLESLRPQVVLVGSWGEIIKSHVLERPDVLIINCHPSKLPAHRGGNPYASVILEQETETGVSFHRMAPQIDAGPILLQQTIPLGPDESGASVRDACSAVAMEMVRPLMVQLAAHLWEGQPLPAWEQDHSQKSYFPPLKPQDGRLDWNQPVDALYRRCRALYPWVMCSGVLESGHEVLFQDPQFQPCPQRLMRRSASPGTILDVNARGLWVALADPQWVLYVQHYQLGGDQGVMPAMMAQMMSWWLLSPGKRFVIP